MTDYVRVPVTDVVHLLVLLEENAAYHRAQAQINWDARLIPAERYHAGQAKAYQRTARRLRALRDTWEWEVAGG